MELRVVLLTNRALVESQTFNKTKCYLLVLRGEGLQPPKLFPFDMSLQYLIAAESSNCEEQLPSTNCQLTVARLLADSQPTNGQQVLA